MSLLDALLLDPYRINVWIAYRLDGVAGSGTQNDPWNGSTAAKFDALMNGLSANTTVHLGPGPFVTNGYADGVAGGWQPKAGMRIIGSGIDVTNVLIAATSTNAHFYAVGHALSSSTMDHVEVSDLTFNCNLIRQTDRAIITLRRLEFGRFLTSSGASLAAIQPLSRSFHGRRTAQHSTLRRGDAAADLLITRSAATSQWQLRDAIRWNGAGLLLQSAARSLRHWR